MEKRSIYQSSRYRAAIRELYETVDLYCSMIRFASRIRNLQNRIDALQGITRIKP